MSKSNNWIIFKENSANSVEIIDKDVYLRLRENNLGDQTKLKKNERKKGIIYFSVNQKIHIDEQWKSQEH